MMPSPSFVARPVTQELADELASDYCGGADGDYNLHGTDARHVQASGAAVQAAATAPFKSRAIDSRLEAGSPDGKLAIYRKEATPRTVWLREMATGRDTELVTFKESIWGMAWSIDSRRIAFSVGSWEIHTVSVTDRSERTLAAHGRVLGWTARGEVFIQLLNDPAKGFALAPAEGGQIRVIYEPPARSPEQPRAILSGRPDIDSCTRAIVWSSAISKPVWTASSSVYKESGGL
jgi:hypothetical protein